MKNRVEKQLFIYALVFAVFLYIGYRVPYCHDEWHWGLSDRFELMKKGFAGYNGRYMGNLLAILITRSVAAKALIIATGVVWLLCVMYKNVYFKEEEKAKENLFLLLSCIFLLLSIPVTLFQQSYGWPAAFVNFFPPVVLFLIYYNWTEWIYVEYRKMPLWKTVLVIPIGFCVQLFSEHVTLFVLLYAAWVVVYTLIRHRKLLAMQVNFLWSSVLGAYLMFSNGAYAKAVGGSGYKRISLDGIAEQFISKIWYHLSINNWVLNVILVGVLLILITKSEKKNFLTAEMIVVFCGFSVYSVFHKVYPQWIFVGNEMLNNGINTVLAMLFFANVLLCIWNLVDKEERISLCILYLSSGAVAAPLLVANPIGARCFYISYVFQALVVVKLFRYLADQYKPDLFCPILAMGMGACILAVIYGRIFFAIGQTNDYRAQLIQTGIEQSQKEIVLPILPYSEYFWVTVPPNEKWKKYFKKFYHIPEDVTLRFE
jgi:hypothetical protein